MRYRVQAMKNLSLAAFLLALGCQSSGGPGAGFADMIVHHAKIITVDPAFRTAEALAIRDGRIVAIGPDEEIFKWVESGKTQVIDAEGHPVLPGLYDSHVHLLAASASELSGPIPEFTSLEDAYAYIRKKAAATP